MTTSPYVGDGRRGGQDFDFELRPSDMTTSRPDFRKALDGVVGARTREATRQLERRNEHLLLGSITKRPS